MAHNKYFLDFRSQENLVDLWIHARTSVRPSVRYQFPRNPRIRFFRFFSSIPGYINAKTISLFGRKFKIGPFLAKKIQNLAFLSKIAPKSVFFAHIFKVTHQTFLTFLMKPCLYKCKKMSVSLFCRKFKIVPFLVKNDPNLSFLAKIAPKSVFFYHIFKVTHQIFS